MVNFIKCQEGVNPGSSLSEKKGKKKWKRGAVKYCRGLTPPGWQGAAVTEGLSMLQSHLMGLDVVLIAKTPWGRQRSGMVEIKPVFNSPLSFLTQNELFWHQFCTSKKTPHYQSYSE